METAALIERALASLWRASWQASVLVPLVLLAQSVFGRRLAPKWRYALWFLVLVRLLLPVTPPSAWSLFNYGNVPRFSAAPFDPGARGDTREIAFDFPRQAPAEVRPVSETSTEPAPARVVTPSPAGQAPAPTARSLVRAALGFLRQQLAWIWFVGVLALSMRLAWGNYLFALQLRRRCPIADPAVLALLEECRRVMGVRPSVTLLEAPELDSPALFGCFRLKLLFPEEMIEAFSPAELRHVFLHELAHVRRGDAAVNWLATILQTLHWFNPVLWFAFHRMREDREVACDELALAHAQEAESKPYGRTVIKVLEGITQATAIPGLVGILEDKKQIKRRIAMIAKFKKTPPWPVLAPVLLLGIGLVSLTDAQTKNAETKEATQKTAETPPAKASTGVTLRKLQGVPEATDVSPDGRYLATSGKDSEAVVFDLTNGTKRGLEIKSNARIFSPDGRQLVTGRREGPGTWSTELVLIDLDTEKSRPLYRNENLRALFARDWSPNGQTILAILQKKDETWQIALISVNDGSVRVLKSVDWRYPGEMNFSPDGRWIVYDLQRTKDSRASSLLLLATDGSREVPLVENSANDKLLGWAPFGEQILFASDRRGTWDAFAIQVADGKAVGKPEVVKKDIGRVDPIGFTRSGAFFYVAEPGGIDVYTAALDPASGKVLGRPTKAVQRFEGANSSPEWSPDGRSLAFLRGKHPGVFILDVETGTEREIRTDVLKDSSWECLVRWSPDGKSLLALVPVDAGGSAIFQIDAQSGISTRVLPNTAAGFGVDPRLAWVQNGRAFYYQRSLTNIVRREIESGVEAIVLESANPIKGFVPSPNGEQIAFASCPESSDVETISVVPASGGEPRTLLKIARPGVLQAKNLAWSPDSRYVFFAKGKNNNITGSLWRVPAAGGDPEEMGLAEMDAVRHLGVSSDGRRITFDAISSQGEVWVLENFLPEKKLAAREVGADGRQGEKSEAFSQPSSERSAAKTTGLTLRKLTEGGSHYGNSHPSPDGRSILMPWKNSMALLDVTSGEQREFGPNLEEPRFSRNGKQIVGTPRNFESGRPKDRNELILFDVETEMSRRLYRNEEIEMITAQDWSPNQQTILAIIDKKDRTEQIALVSVNDGSERVLKSFDWQVRPSVLNFSPDGRWIVYVTKTGDDRELFLLAADGSREIPLRQQSVGGLLGWAPVGDRILFLSDRRGTWDAFALRVADGKPVGEAELIKQGIGRVQPMGFARNGACFYEFTTSTEDVFVAELDLASGKVQGTPTNAARQFQGSNKFADWSPDGKSLAYISTRRRSYGNYFGDVYIRNLETGAERELITDAGDDGLVAKALWSPDGRSFLAVGVHKGESRLYRIDAQTGKSAFVFEPTNNFPGVLAFEWAGDGKSIYYPDDRAHLFVRRDLETGAETKVQIGTTGFRAFPSPNGQHIAFYPFGNSTIRSINLMPADGGEGRPLVELAPPYYLPGYPVVEWAPDSRYVVFAKWNIDDLKTTTLWRVPVTGGEPEYLGLEMERIQRPRISRDGRRIAFTAGTWKHERWVMENFLPEKQVAAK